MHFLITNDDGYDAPGIVALENALAPLGRVTVVAPDRHLSGCSHQVTTDRPVEIRQHRENHYAIGGLPADCVRVGLLHLATDCDWVISGINEGANLGCDLHYSGTVAAAREAVLFGRPAMAVSHYHTNPRSIEWQLAARVTQEIVAGLLAEPLPAGSLWNVNLPAAERLSRETPTRRCPVDSNRLDVAYDIIEGTLHYRHGRYHDRPRTVGSDVDVCFSGHIAITRVEIHASAEHSAQRLTRDPRGMA